MVGDREKCIEAQMDEYLSKPLKQNQLIQTILKCATLGGALSEGNANDSRLTGRDDTLSAGSSALPPKSPGRPSLEIRAFTAAGQGQSPSIMSAEAGDLMDKVRKFFQIV